jgi:YVTN family beta-propeller protein
MRATSVMLAVCCWLSAASGQSLEKVIYLPDSLSGVLRPSCIALDSVDAKVYISGTYAHTNTRLVDCFIVVAEAATDRKLARIAVRGPTSSMCYNPVVSKLYAAHPDSGVVSVIDPIGDTVVAQVAGIPRAAWLCCNTTTGRVYCIAQGANGALTVIDPAGDTVVRTIPLPGGQSAVAFLPRVNKVYSARGGTVCVLDAQSDSFVREIALPAHIWDMAVSTTRDRAYFLLGGAALQLAVVDTRNDSLLRCIPVGGADNAGMLCYNPRRDELYFPGFSDTILVLGGASDSVVRRLYAGAGSWQFYMTCLPEQNLLFLADIDTVPEQVRALDLVSGVVVGTVRVGRSPIATAVDAARGKAYYVNQESDDVTVIPAPTGPLKTGRIVVGARPSKVCYAEESDMLYCPDRVNSIVSVIDCESNRVVANVPAGYEMNDICYSPASNKVYVTNGLDSSVTVIDCATNTAIANLRVGEIPRALVYSPVRNRVYCASYLSEVIAVIDCESDSVVARVVTRPVDPHGLFYNPALDEVYCCGALAELTAIVDCGSNRVVGEWPYYVGRPIVYAPPAGKIYYFGDIPPSMGQIHVIDALQDSIIDSIDAPGTACCYNPIDNKVYFADLLCFTVVVIDVAGDTIIKVIQGLPNPEDIVHDTVHNRVYVAGGVAPGRVWILDGASDSLVGCVETRSQRPVGLAWNPSRGCIYTANSQSGSVSVIRDTSPPAVAESARPAITRRVSPTPTRARDIRSAAALTLFDAVGRRLPTSSGASPSWAVRPGVYFAIGQDGRADKFVIVR